MQFLFIQGTSLVLRTGRDALASGYGCSIVLEVIWFLHERDAEAECVARGFDFEERNVMSFRTGSEFCVVVVSESVS